MECDEAHAAEGDALVDAGDDCVVYFVVMAMPPPDEDIGLSESFGGEAVLGLVEGGDVGGDVLVAQMIGNGCVNTVRVDGLYGRVSLLLAVFVPDGNGWLSVYHAMLRYVILHKFICEK